MIMLAAAMASSGVIDDIVRAPADPPGADVVVAAPQPRASNQRPAVDHEAIAEAMRRTYEQMTAKLEGDKAKAEAARQARAAQIEALRVPDEPVEVIPPPPPTTDPFVPELPPYYPRRALEPQVPPVDWPRTVIVALAAMTALVVGFKHGSNTGVWLMEQVRRRAAIVMAAGAAVCLFVFTIGPDMLADEYGQPPHDLVYLGFLAGCVAIVGAYHWITAPGHLTK